VERNRGQLKAGTPSRSAAATRSGSQTRRGGTSGIAARTPAARGRPSSRRVPSDLHGPPPPAAFQDAVHLERLLPPVGHALPRIPGECQTGVLQPRPEPIRMPRAIRRPARIERGDQGVVQRHQLGRRGTAAQGARPVLLQGGHEVGLFQDLQVVGDRLQGAGILELSASFWSERICAGAATATANTCWSRPGRRISGRVRISRPIAGPMIASRT